MPHHEYLPALRQAVHLFSSQRPWWYRWLIRKIYLSFLCYVRFYTFVYLDKTINILELNIP